MSRLTRGLTKTRLRLVLGALFLALCLPSIALIVQAQRQIKWEAFHQYQTLAEELAQRIDGELQRWVAAEEARGYADYQFLVVAGDPASNYVQRSPLAQFPVAPPIPGLIGWFQVDAEGAFSTPVLPAAGGDAATLGLSADELAQRGALRDRLLDVMSRNQLVDRRR